MSAIELALLLLLASSDAASRLEEARTAVAQNLRRIESYSFQTRCEKPEYVPDSPIPVAIVYEVTQSKDRRLRWVTTHDFPEGVPRITNDDVSVFDGREGRAVGLNKNGEQVGGAVLNDEDIRDLYASSHAGSEFGRCSGLLIDGQSLSAWLTLDSAQYEGEEDVDGAPCAKFSVQEYIFYLDPKLHFALRKYAVKDEHGQPCFAMTSTGFKEALPGLWLPEAGYFRPFDIPWRGGKLTKIAHWTLTSLSLNEDYPDDLFKLEFSPGITVVDRRFPVPGGYLQRGKNADPTFGVTPPSPGAPSSPRASSPQAQPDSEADLEKEFAEFQAEVAGGQEGMRWSLRFAGGALLAISAVVWWTIRKARRAGRASSPEEGA
ncbi:MAG: hypothetical protein RBU21_10860 [FCB group bacterium]|jgi:outer membrane lipoprotein-sorting protein|nr:hypothetical protein [FCB group bacterium]